MSKEAQKEKSMILQKEMIEGLFNDLANAKELGKKVCYTFIPGNLGCCPVDFGRLIVKR